MQSLKSKSQTAPQAGTGPTAGGVTDNRKRKESNTKKNPLKNNGFPKNYLINFPTTGNLGKTDFLCGACGITSDKSFPATLP